MKSKTIIISNEKSSARGILTLSEENDLLNCKIRLYGINHLPATTKIGIFHNEKVYSANLIERNNCYMSSLVGDFDMDGDFYCALVDTASGNSVLLSGGTYAGYYFNSDSVFENFDTPGDTPNTPPVPTLDENEPNKDDFFSSPTSNSPYGKEDFSQVSPAKDDFAHTAPAKDAFPAEKNPSSPASLPNNTPNSENIVPSMCENCQYKAYFYGENIKFDLKNLSAPISPSTSSENDNDSRTPGEKVDAIKESETTAENEINSSRDNPAPAKELAPDAMHETKSSTLSAQNAEPPTPTTENPPEPLTPSLLHSIAQQFDYVFENYAPDPDLTSRIENSKFAKMNDPESETEYSIGAIFTDATQKKMKYICYAVKSPYDTPAPEELGTHHQWLPLDPDDPLSDGYYLVYQDATDLKIIEV